MNQEAIEWIMGAMLTIVCFVILPMFGWALSNMNQSIKDNTLEISKLWSKCAEIVTNVEWIKAGVRTMGNNAGDILHSPHTPEFDRLIEAFWHGTLTDEQVVELNNKLEEISIQKETQDMTAGQKALLQAQKMAAGTMLGSLYILHPKGL